MTTRPDHYVLASVPVSTPGARCDTARVTTNAPRGPYAGNVRVEWLADRGATTLSFVRFTDANELEALADALAAGARWLRSQGAR